MTYPIQNVINWFLAKEAMTPKKLQKILYYAYSWTITLENENANNIENRLFENEFEAWVHGPVIREVYESFRIYGYQEIPQYQGSVPQFSQDVEDILTDVWEEYGQYSGNELESISHQEDPWIKARAGFSPLERCTNKISDDDIFNYYIQRVEYVE